MARTANRIISSSGLLAMVHQMPQLIVNQCTVFTYSWNTPKYTAWSVSSAMDSTVTPNSGSNSGLRCLVRVCSLGLQKRILWLVGVSNSSNAHTSGRASHGSSRSPASKAPQGPRGNSERLASRLQPHPLLTRREGRKLAAGSPRASPHVDFRVAR